MKRGWFLLLALSLGLNAGLLYVSLSGSGDPQKEPRSSGGARPPHAPRGEHPGDPQPMDPARLIDEHLGRMTDVVGLDRPQQESIRALLEQSVPQITDQRMAVDAARRKLGELFSNEDLDSEAYRAATREIHRAQFRLDSLVSEAILKEASVLDHPQRELYLRTMPWRPPDRMPPPNQPPGRKPPPPPRGR